jgi:CHAD domain-containing protein
LRSAVLREREIKLAARAPEALEELVRMPAIADFELAPVELREQQDVYLDTEDFLLFTAGYALRHRRCCGLVKAALKEIQSAEGRGLVQDRGEIEEDLGADGEPKGAVAEQLASLAGGAQLLPILRLRTRRRVRKVLASGRPVAELCLDEVEVSPGEESAAPKGRFFEVEVEETDEGSGVLDAVGEALLASPHFEPSLLSKLERGLDILDRGEASGRKPPQSLSAATPCFRLAGALGAREIERWLAERFSTATVLETLETKTFYDSFDWRIHESGGTFETAESDSGRESVWRDATGRVRHRLCHAGAPGFPKDLPAGAMRDELASVLCERRLLPLVTLKARVRSVAVLDGEQKTTVRLHIESGTSSLPEGGEPHELEPRLRVAPVRGYGAEGAQVAAFLRTECGLLPDAASELEHALAPLGRKPGDYTSKFQLELDPAMPASHATRAIHLSLLETMLRNEEGTRRDLDSEFLHDFRVAIRRTRSALTQIREVYPAPVALRFKEEFRWLGSETGPERDLAVFLLKIDAYREGLPPEVRADLDPLQEFLERKQKLAHDRLVSALDSERYRRLVDDWRAFLDEKPADSAVARNAQRPIHVVASERIWRVYRRMVKRGRAMDESSPAEAFHDMRIRVKKLRYLLEFFRSLYSEQAIGRIVARLKRLQDNLGDLNDCRVQRQSVRRFAAEMAEQGSAPVGSLLAMGRLLERLDAASAAERRRFAKRFKGLASGEKEDFARLFSPENEP